MNEVVLATRKYKAGYEVRDELHRTDFEAIVIDEGKAPTGARDIAEYINQNKGVTLVIKSAYTPTGDYIGDKKRAHFLCSKKGIKPEKRTTTSKVCSIGWCQSERRWYGWSHRAICGFGVGDTVKKGDCTNSSGYTEEYLKAHPEDDGSLPVGFTAHDFNDCKKMAIAFAESVS